MPRSGRESSGRSSGPARPQTVEAATNFAAWSVSQGVSSDITLARMTVQFMGLSESQISLAYQTGSAAYFAGETGVPSAAGAFVAGAGTPSVPFIPNQYRYYVTVGITDPATGHVEYANVVEDSDKRYRRSQLERRLQTEYADISTIQSPKANRLSPGGTISLAEVIAVMKRS